MLEKLTCMSGILGKIYYGSANVHESKKKASRFTITVDKALADTGQLEVVCEYPYLSVVTHAQVLVAI